MHMKADAGSLLKFRARIETGAELSRAEAEELFDLLRRESDVAQIASLLQAWRAKGYSVDEIAACASILRNEVRRVETSHQVFVDVVGTGGSRTKTFNVSTAAAFVASGAGLPVAKHGNRAASSRTGSADALSELGVGLAADAGAASRSLDKHGICFMFAPHFHNLSKALAEARRSIGRPTIFNLLGPIANPAGAPFQLIGVWNAKNAQIYGEALKGLGTRRSWIVHGKDGLDEVTLDGPTEVRAVTEDGVDTFEIAPSDFGIKEQKMDAVRAEGPEESARTVLGVLKGEIGGAARDLVTINAAAALFVAGVAEDLRSARELAEESIDSGSAARKLNLLIEETGK
jgi:anthranilate phosphoribosyltransferase